MQLKYANMIGSGVSVYKGNMIGLRYAPGDIFCIKEGKMNFDRDIGKLWNGHTGIVEYEANNGRTVHTVQGNTNAAGSRNGDRVAEKDMNTGLILAVIRI